ncbi:MAG: LysM peptidoglycan-binding domain-containing protein, partial [Phycisphaerae bacterium]|nr:LysM peptidoglycan-binding domain-containing protein [Phycisphaerae bacterium]
ERVTEQPAPEGERPGVRRHTYVVERGDTLTSIARNVLHDPERWREIYELNQDKIPDPDLLVIGTELRLPEE